MRDPGRCALFYLINILLALLETLGSQHMSRFSLAIFIIYTHATNIKIVKLSATHEHSLQHAHTSLFLGLAHCHCTTICRQIKFNQFDLGTLLQLDP